MNILDEKLINVCNVNDVMYEDDHVSMNIEDDVNDIIDKSSACYMWSPALVMTVSSRIPPSSFVMRDKQALPYPD